MQSGEVLLASSDADGHQTARASDSPAISANGRYVAFRSEGNEFYEEPTNVMDYDVWLKDLTTGAVRLVSVGGDGHDTLGAALEVALDARAETVVFSSLAANLVSPDENGVADVFVSVKSLRPVTGSATRLVTGSH